MEKEKDIIEEIDEKTEKTSEERLKELEQEYQKKLQELSAKEAELQPLLDLQRFLQQNPDKMRKIVNALQEEEASSGEDIFSEEDEIKKLKKEIADLKDQIILQQEDKIIERETQMIRGWIQDYQRMYGSDFDIDKYFSRMMAFQDGYLDRLSDLEFKNLSDKVAKMVVDTVKRERENWIKSYIEKKAELGTKASSETKPSVSGRTKEEVKVSLDDGSAKRMAYELLKKFST